MPTDPEQCLARKPPKSLGGGGKIRKNVKEFTSQSSSDLDYDSFIKGEEEDTGEEKREGKRRGVVHGTSDRLIQHHVFA